MITINRHLVVTDSEHQMIVNALAFYNDYHACDLLGDDDSIEQWRIAFLEDNCGTDPEGLVDKLATKIANNK